MSSNVQPDQPEISLLDALSFLKSNYKIILVFGVLGIGVTLIYLAAIPNRFEATAQVTMRQMAANNRESFILQGINIEEPTQLIRRLSAPSSFDLNTINACGLEGNSNGAVVLANDIKLIPIKGITSNVDLKVVRASPEAALRCANAIFELIKSTQTQMASPFLEGANFKLAEYEERLERAKEFITKTGKSDSAVSAAYLFTRDEIRFLLDEIAALKNMAVLNQNRATRLITPIYVLDVPITPNKRVTIAAGFMVGLFLGLLMVMGHRKLKRSGLKLVG